MGIFAGLASLAGLSLFLAWRLRVSSALMPLVAASAGMLWFTVFGCLGLLYYGSIAWYILCAVAVLWLVVSQKANVKKLVSPGYLCFVLGAVLMITLFLYTKPMLTQWDEFTFWGTNAKITSTHNQLYTTAPTTQIARSYPPGLVVFSYMMQFFGGYSEAGQIAAYAVLYLACFAAGTAVWGKNRPAAILMMVALCMMPMLFETGGSTGGLMHAYLVCMADIPLGAVFGGALCYYFAADANGVRRLVPFGIILAALCNIKDIGLALALVALAVATLDLLARGVKNMRFWRLRGGAAFGVFLLYGLAMVAGVYMLWAWHLATSLPQAMNRFDIGTSEQSLGQAQMLLSGVKMLFGIGRSEKFAAILGQMAAALFARPVGLLGPGIVVFLGLCALFGLSVWLCTQKALRRRAVVFFFGMVAFFAAFYVFNIFTYTFIFSDVEAYILKDYGRYIAPFWMGWLMAALVLLGKSTADEKSSFARRRAAKLVAVAASAALALAGVVRFGWQASFLQQSPSIYGERLNLQAVVAEARQQGMQPQDVVYIISQEDDGTRFYILGFEMEAQRALLYTGPLYGEDDNPALDMQGHPIFTANVASTLADPEGELWRPYDVGCTAQELAEYLKTAGCTHLLLDVVDDYILEELGALADDGMAGWQGAETGHRYYRIEWLADGSMRLAAQEGGAA